MNFLMLRGQVPQDRDPQEIVFDKIEDCDDVWAQLIFSMLKKEDQAELWYWGGNREKKFTFNFTERWIPSFQTYKSVFIPDVIFCRGGFKEYHSVLKQFPTSFKIRYGAGRRYLPCQGFYDYDLILQDSIEQLKICKQRFPRIPSSLFIKPAPDNLFYPYPEIKKEYDICFPANGSQNFKGHAFVYNTLPPRFTLLNLGNNPRNFKYPNNVTSYRVLKSEMPKHIAKCKMGIIAVDSEIDSCPRVIAEMLACGLPIVVLDTVRFWRDKYINSLVNPKSRWATGELVTKDNFWTAVQYVLDNLNKYNPREYYKENLSLEIAAKFLKEKINVLGV